MIIYDIMVKLSLMGKNKAHEPEIININYTINIDTAKAIIANGNAVINNGMLDFMKKNAILDERKYKILNSNSTLKQIELDIPKMEAIKTLLEDFSEEDKAANTIVIDPVIEEIFNTIESGKEDRELKE